MSDFSSMVKISSIFKETLKEFIYKKLFTYENYKRERERESDNLVRDAANIKCATRSVELKDVHCVHHILGYIFIYIYINIYNWFTP